MADPTEKQDVAAAPALPPGLEPIGGSPSTRIMTEPFSAAATSPQLPEGLEASRPGLGQRAAEAAIGAVQGAARDMPVVAGGLAGAKLGLGTAPMVAPFLGPLTPAYVAATTMAGLGAGFIAGQEADRWFPAVSREDLIPYREGGKTFGSAIGTAPMAFGLPVMTGNRVSRFISGFGEMARRNPKTYLGTEALSATSMGIAGGAAESYFPGQEGVRLGAELGAGVLGKLLLSAVDTTKGAISAARGTRDPSRLEGKAATLLLDVLEKNGQDPEALIKALRANLPSTVPTPTSGQKTGNQVLLDLESSLAEHHAQFGGETRRQGRTAMLAYQELINQLEASSDPALFRAAAQLREDAFRTLLNSRLSAADAAAAQSIAKITKDTPAARAAIGEIVKGQTETALREAREYESQLWRSAYQSLTTPDIRKKYSVVPMEGNQASRIFDNTGKWPGVRVVDTTITPRTVPVNATADAFLARASEVGDALFEDAIPASVRRLMQDLGVDKAAVQRYKLGKSTEQYVDIGIVPSNFRPEVKDIDAGELVNYRSTLLKMAREAAGKGDVNNAEFFGTLAEGMLDDLGKLQNREFDQARAYSKALNDVFTRTFAKTASETGDLTRTGAQRLPAEILVSRAFGSGADVTAMRMGQIEGAVNFMRTQYDEAVAQFGKNSAQAKALKPMADAAKDRVVSIQDAQARVLRLAAAEAVDTVYDNASGQYIQRLNFPKLTRFAQQNAPLLERLGIMGDLRDAAHASNLLTQVQKSNSVMEKTVQQQAAFARVLASENPTQVVASALTSKFPVKQVRELAGLAMVSGPDAVNGLKASILDYAYTKAGGTTGNFNVRAYEDALFSPIARGQPSIAKILSDNGLMRLSEVKNMKRLITPMVRIEEAMRNNVPFDDIVTGANAAEELAMRIVGAKIGSSMTSGGSSLIAASAGSKAVRQIFDNLPNTTVRQILENAAKDPDAMALLLQRGRNDKEGLQIADRLLNFLGKIGVSVGKSAVTPALNYYSREEPRPSQIQDGQMTPLTPQGDASRMLRRLPVAPSTRGVPFMMQQPSQPPGKGAPPGPTSGAPTNANSRAMLQSLFPFDTIAGLAAQQPPTQVQ